VSELLSKVMSKVEPLTDGLVMPDDHQDRASLAKFGAVIDGRMGELSVAQLKLVKLEAECGSTERGAKVSLETAEMNAMAEDGYAACKNDKTRKAYVALKTTKQQKAVNEAHMKAAEASDALKLVEVAKSRLRYAKEVLSGQVSLASQG